MSNTTINPIRTVDGVAIPKVPSTYLWKLEDVSAPDAGRTEDALMHKKRIGSLIGLELQWNYVTVEEAAAILAAFQPEYINVCYLDALAGDYVTAEFYVGNRSTPLYNAKLGLWENISFNIIQRGVTLQNTNSEEE